MTNYMIDVLFGIYVLVVNLKFKGIFSKERVILSFRMQAIGRLFFIGGAKVGSSFHSLLVDLRASKEVCLTFLPLGSGEGVCSLCSRRHGDFWSSSHPFAGSMTFYETSS